MIAITLRYARRAPRRCHYAYAILLPCLLATPLFFSLIAMLLSAADFRDFDAA